MPVTCAEYCAPWARRKGRDKPPAHSFTHNPFERPTMYQKSSGQQPTPELAAAMAKFEQATAEQIAYGIANIGGIMPRNLTPAQRRAVLALVKNAPVII